MAARDFLEAMIDKRTARNSDFPKLLDAARAHRELGNSTAPDFVAADLTHLPPDASTQPER
jgi:hypothetical protein